MSLKLRLRNWHQKHRRGDTLIEVAIAITVFCLISILSVSLMDRNLSTVQGSLELTMTRNEIDAQAEALRYIHDSVISEYNTGDDTYQALWNKLTELAKNPNDISSFDTEQCRNYTNNNGANYASSIARDNGFIINSRNINPKSVDETIIQAKNNTSTFTTSSLYPRLIFTTNGNNSANNSDQLTETNLYTQIARAEGIWVVAAKDGNDPSEFVDYYIRSCWYAPGNNNPSTISTVLRLYNPDISNQTNQGIAGFTTWTTNSNAYNRAGKNLIVTIPYKSSRSVAELKNSLTVTIGGTSCPISSVSKQDYTIKVTCKLPDRNTGNYDVTATMVSPSETLSWLATQKIQYINKPSATISPTIVYGSGATISIALDSATVISKINSITVGGTNCTLTTNTTVNANKTTAKCTAPSKTAGAKYPVVVSVLLKDGTTLATTASNQLEYKSLPAVSISPTSTIRVVGGDTLTATVSINDANKINSITIGGTTCTSLSYSNGRATCKMPAKGVGKYNVIANVTTKDGVARNIAASSQLEYKGIPTPTASISPTYTYNVDGGDTLTVSFGNSGSISKVNSVAIGGTTCTNLGYSGGRATCRMPSKGFGNHAVSVNVTLTSGSTIALNAGNINYRNLTFTVSYRAHVQTYGWQDWVSNGATAGTTGQSKRLEALQITLTDNFGRSWPISYQPHLEGPGWVGWVSSGATAGTTGESRRLEAIIITLPPSLAGRYNVRYNAHIAGLGWQGWVYNGAVAGTTGQSTRMEAIQIVVEKK